MSQVVAMAKRRIGDRGKPQCRARGRPGRRSTESPSAVTKLQLDDLVVQSVPNLKGLRGATALSAETLCQTQEGPSLRLHRLAKGADGRSCAVREKGEESFWVAYLSLVPIQGVKPKAKAQNTGQILRNTAIGCIDVSLDQAHFLMTCGLS